ncbi:MAG TPA: aminotransferase DegT, partial [Ruminococcaceae bacterium]|nr:aminotransferase DegT [Oscillospiraceae bacterium]
MEEIKFNDLGAQYRALKKDIDAAITNVIADSRFISGPQVEQLEAELCAYTGRKYCVTCGNGTDALRMPLMAWGIKPGDAVFVPAFTFYASSEVISLCGATPVFVDSCPDTFNMDPEDLKKKIAEVKVTRKLVPRAIIAVDLFGQPAQFPEISQIAEENHLLLLEDGAQGFGGRIGEAHACSFGNASATSFFPA